MLDIEKQVKDFVLELVKELKAQDETIHYFTFTIEASGRVDGDVKISYKLDGDVSDRMVEGSAPGPVFDEFIRRRTWTKRHKAKEISFVKTPLKEDLDDSIPF